MILILKTGDKIKVTNISFESQKMTAVWIDKEYNGEFSIAISCVGNEIPSISELEAFANNQIYS